MMKKLFPVAAVAAGILLSAQANAAAVGFNASRPISATQCPALDNDITVQLSKNVNAAYNCNATSIVAAACHTNGTNKSQTITCLYYNDTSTTPAVMKPYPAHATAGCPATAPTTGTNTVTFTGRVAYGAPSGGGSVGATPLGAITCDTTTVKAVAPDAMLDMGTSTSSD